MANARQFCLFCGCQESHKQLDDDVDLEAEIEEELKQEELVRVERMHRQRAITVRECGVRENGGARGGDYMENTYRNEVVDAEYTKFMGRVFSWQSAGHGPSTQIHES